MLILCLIDSTAFHFQRSNFVSFIISWRFITNSSLLENEEEVSFAQLKRQNFKDFC